MRRGMYALAAAICIPVAGYGGEPLTADSLPAQWQFTPQAQMQMPATEADRWWRQFDDPALDQVIATIVARNYSLEAALHRAEASRRAIDAARSGWYPTVAINAGYDRSRTSLDEAGHYVTATAGTWSAGLSARWEIDLFGRVASQVRQKKQQYRASRAEVAAAMVSLAAQGGSAYVTLRQMQSLLEVASRHAANQRKIVDMAIARFDAGLASKLDVAQAWQTYYQTTSQIPPLEKSTRQALSALSVLMATPVDQLPSQLEAAATLPDCHQLVAAGYPAALLRRRPDIIEAEAQAAAAASAVGIAKKEFLPTLAIEGTIGTQARDIGDLFTDKTLTYSVTPTLTWTVFDGLSRKYNVAEARETARAAVDRYNETVTEAVGEVNNALAAYDASMRQLLIIDNLNAQCQEALKLAVERYRDSLAPMSDVVTAQLNALNAETSGVQAHADALQALIQLYEALGGNPYDYE